MPTRLTDLSQIHVRFWAPKLIATLVLGWVALLVPHANAANYPLELVSPRQAGTAPAVGFESMPSGHRIFRAYPGLPYNIRAVVIGGEYPFTYSLSNAPSGMTINASTGEINWANPTGSSVTPTINVTDAEGSRVSSPWTITVTNEGFKFISPSGSDTAAGTIDAPWRTLMKLHSSTSPADIVYFRAGAYSVDGIPRTSVGTAWERVEFDGSRSARWLAYPGEAPAINLGYSGADPGVLIRFMNNSTYPIYVEGLEAYNFRNIGIQVVSSVSNFTVLRRLRIHDMVQGVDGENPAGIMFTSGYNDASQYAAVQDSEFYRLNGGGGLKVYSQKKVVIEGNRFHDSSYGFDLKSHVPRFDVRDNVFFNIAGDVLYGNMHENNGEPASGEIRFNNFNTSTAPVAVDLNRDSMAREIFVHRNTIVGRAQVRFADSSDGPFRFSNNVIVNNDSGTPSGSHVTHYNVSDASRIVLADNLVGTLSSGIVDSSGLLTANYVRYLGTHGHQLGTPPDRPSPPVNVIVE